MVKRSVLANRLAPAKYLAGICLVLLSGIRSQAATPPWSTFTPEVPLAVTTVTGQIVRGKIDPRTTSQQLWLTVEAEGMTISSILSASEVVEIQPAEEVQLPIAMAMVIAPQQAMRAANAPRSTQAKSLQIYAHYANWDSDPEPDGLRLLIAPLSANGEVIPISGSLSARLQVYRGEWRGSQGSFREEESWGRQVAATRFGPEGLLVDLPFSKLQPLRDREVFPLGELQVRLNVAGHGTFDALQRDVQLEPQSYTQDLRSRSRGRQLPAMRWNP